MQDVEQVHKASVVKKIDMIESSQGIHESEPRSSAQSSGQKKKQTPQQSFTVQGHEPDSIFGCNRQILKEQVSKHRQQRSQSINLPKGSGQFPKAIQQNQFYQRNCIYRIDTSQHQFLKDKQKQKLEEEKKELQRKKDEALLQINSKSKGKKQSSQIEETQIPKFQEPKEVALSLVSQDMVNDFMNIRIKACPDSGRNPDIATEQWLQNVWPSVNPSDFKNEFEPEEEESDEEDHFTEEKIKAKCLARIEVETPPPVELRVNSGPTSLFFNSNFDSGNLNQAFQVGPFEYDLVLNYDTNTTMYTQWYNFSVLNSQAGHTYKFNIINLVKEDSSYSQGMKPFVCSLRDNEAKGRQREEWQRGCFNVGYQKNKNKTKDRESAPDYEYDEENIPFYVYEDKESQMLQLSTLTFSYTFQYDNDIVFFAHFQPFSYTDLLDYLWNLSVKNAKQNNSMLRVQTLCQTVENRLCPILTITENIEQLDQEYHYNKKQDFQQILEMHNEQSEQKGFFAHKYSKTTEDLQFPCQQQQSNGGIVQPQVFVRETNQGKKPVIFITARVHPGESNAQPMCTGLLNFLLLPQFLQTPESRLSQQLRENYVFKIVPMLNPDGVYNGNYRTNSIGVDLNRRWINPSKILHPTLWHCKEMLRSLVSRADVTGGVALYLDMHGHSRKRNVFMYGCNYNDKENQFRNNNLIKIIPNLMAQRNPKMFSSSDCKFANEKDKESTGRIVVFKELGILTSYTLESTYYACTTQAKQYPQQVIKTKKYQVDESQQVKASDLQKIGEDLGHCLLSVVSSRVMKKKFGQFCQEQVEEAKEQIKIFEDQKKKEQEKIQKEKLKQEKLQKEQERLQKEQEEQQEKKKKKESKNLSNQNGGSMKQRKLTMRPQIPKSQVQTAQKARDLKPEESQQKKGSQQQQQPQVLSNSFCGTASQTPEIKQKELRFVITAKKNAGDLFSKGNLIQGLKNIKDQQTLLQGPAVQTIRLSKLAKQKDLLEKQSLLEKTEIEEKRPMTSLQPKEKTRQLETKLEPNFHQTQLQFAKSAQDQGGPVIMLVGVQNNQVNYDIQKSQNNQFPIIKPPPLTAQSKPLGSQVQMSTDEEEVPFMSNPILQRALKNQAKTRENRISSSQAGHAQSFSGSPVKQLHMQDSPQDKEIMLKERTPKNHNKSSQNVDTVFFIRKPQQNVQQSIKKPNLQQKDYKKKGLFHVPNNSKPTILKKKDIKKKSQSKKEQEQHDETTEYGNNTIQGRKLNFQNYNQQVLKSLKHAKDSPQKRAIQLSQQSLGHDVSIPQSQSQQKRNNGDNKNTTLKKKKKKDLRRQESLKAQKEVKRVNSKSHLEDENVVFVPVSQTQEGSKSSLDRMDEYYITDQTLISQFPNLIQMLNKSQAQNEDKTIVMTFQKRDEQSYNYAIPDMKQENQANLNNSNIPYSLINQTFEQKNLLRSKNNPLQTQQRFHNSKEQLVQSFDRQATSQQAGRQLNSSTNFPQHSTLAEKFVKQNLQQQQQQQQRKSAMKHQNSLLATKVSPQHSELISARSDNNQRRSFFTQEEKQEDRKQKQLMQRMLTLLETKK